MTTYADLQADIISFAQRDDVASVVPTWVKLATARMNRVLRVPEMEARDYTTITSEYTVMPLDFLEIRAVKDSANRELRYLGAQQFASVVASGKNMDVPIYCIEDLRIRIYPAPTAASPLVATILYYERI